MRTIPTQVVFVVMIDIKDGVYDAIHCFANRPAAQAYVDWQLARSGDHCYISELDVEYEWALPATPSDHSGFLWSYGPEGLR